MDAPLPPPNGGFRYSGLCFPSVFLATGAGVGLTSPVPGTIGCLWGIPITFLLSKLPHPGWQLLALISLAGLGVVICGRAARILGRKDPSAVVWDEFSTLPITFFLVPPEFLASVVVIGIGFGLHRLFDIWKPFPCRQLERLPEGWGIMADDWVAAIYSCLSLHCILATQWFL